MSGPEPPRSRIVELVRASHPAGAPIASGRRPFRRRLSIRFAAMMRWLHIYISLFSLALILFFSLTGVTLNHPGWFGAGAERVVEAGGTLNARWLHADPPAEAVDKLEIVEHLRKTHGVRGALAEFRVDDRECVVTFKGPGYAADAFIDRASGTYTLTATDHGWVALINDLHKGRDTGPGWSALIDASALFMTIVSLTGLVLLFYLKLRRYPGLVVVLLGAVAALAAYLLLVP